METKTGIYKITNTANGKIYIGKSFDIDKRFKQHLSSLKRDVHVNKKLQDDYNLFGKESFSFEIVELCDYSLLDRLESIYCYDLDVWTKGYNIMKLLDYRNISREEAIEIKNLFIDKVVSNNMKLIKKAKTISLEVEWIASQMKKSVEEMLIVLREITFDDQQRNGIGINLYSSYTKHFLSIIDQDHIDESLMNFKL